MYLKQMVMLLIWLLVITGFRLEVIGYMTQPSTLNSKPPIPNPVPKTLHIMEGRAQGTSFTIRYVSDREIRREAIDSIFQVIDKSLSIYRENSLISEFNKSGRVLMDEHMEKVVLASLQAYRESGGAFDITSASLSELWGFGNSKMVREPTRSQVKKRLTVTGSDLIVVRGDSLVALKKGVRIDCNGIAQGYTVDLVFSYLQDQGLKDMMVELGGEVRAGGRHPQRGYWVVGVEGPSSVSGSWHPVQKSLCLEDRAITTSGSYRNFVRAGNARYGHIIDPRQGRPVDNEMISVTVMAETAMTADAYDNIFFVWGKHSTLKYLQGKKDLGVYLVFRDRSGNIRDTMLLSQAQ
jgi:thiamine biosynthesis lipoprotein